MERTNGSEDQYNSDRLRLALDAAQFGVWEVTLPDRTLVWDETCGRLFGRAPNEYPTDGFEFLLCVHPEDRGLVTATMSETIREGTDYRCEFRILWPDGQIRWHSVFGRRILSRSGVPEKILGVCTDTTTRRTIEQMLSQSQRMEVVARLAGGIAHDFNNLMTVIDGHAALLLESLLPEDPHRASLESILAATRQANSLTVRLRSYSRDQKAVPEQQNLSRIVHESKSLLSRTINRKCSLKICRCDHEATILADRLQVLQAIVNLCTNSCDAMPDGGVIELNVYRETIIPEDARVPARCRAGEYVVFSVTDTGCGIPAADHKKVFEPFFTTKEFGTRTGLGLAIVQGIIEHCGGFIELSTPSSSGCTVSLFFPSSTVVNSSVLTG